jgi:hypothetical protein
VLPPPSPRQYWTRRGIAEWLVERLAEDRPTLTHAGLPWLRHLRRALGTRLHCWPFDGWTIPRGHSAIVEVYPSLWKHLFPRADRTPDQHDAYAAAAWMRAADLDGSLGAFLAPTLTSTERVTASIEGWILGVA